MAKVELITQTQVDIPKSSPVFFEPQSRTEATITVPQLITDFLITNPEFGKNQQLSPANYLGFKEPPSLSAATTLVSHLQPQSYSKALQSAKEVGKKIPRHLPQIIVDELVSHTLLPNPAFALNQLVTDYQLSANQFTYLLLTAEGANNKQIAAQLNLSEKTVRNYSRALRKKVNPQAVNKAQLIASPAFKPLIEPKLFPNFETGRIKSLTNHQLEILSLLTYQTKTEVGRSLSITLTTVEHAMEVVFQKLHCLNQAAAVTTFLLAQKEGLI